MCRLLIRHFNQNHKDEMWHILLVWLSIYSHDLMDDQGRSVYLSVLLRVGQVW